MCLQKVLTKVLKLNSSEYDICWDYDFYSLKFIFYYSKPVVIWAEGLSSHPQEQALKFAQIYIAWTVT